jgi:hypothetical protein
MKNSLTQKGKRITCAILLAVPFKAMGENVACTFLVVTEQDFCLHKSNFDSKFDDIHSFVERRFYSG